MLAFLGDKGCCDICNFSSTARSASDASFAACCRCIIRTPMSPPGPQRCDCKRNRQFMRKHAKPVPLLLLQKSCIHNYTVPSINSRVPAHANAYRCVLISVAYRSIPILAWLCANEARPNRRLRSTSERKRIAVNAPMPFEKKLFCLIPANHV